MGNLSGKGRSTPSSSADSTNSSRRDCLTGRWNCLSRHGVLDKDITVCRVPGSFEIPYAAQKLALSRKFDAVICLGALIRGDTPHFDYIAAETAKGIASISLQTQMPVISASSRRIRWSRLWREPEPRQVIKDGMPHYRPLKWSTFIGSLTNYDQTQAGAGTCSQGSLRV